MTPTARRGSRPPWRRLVARVGGVSAIVAALVDARAAGAASLVLRETERVDAIRFGAASVEREAFDMEWRVENGQGEHVVVVTPFHRVAVLARHAAFRNQAPKAADVDRALRDAKERLTFWADLTGRSEDFARPLKPELRVGDRTIKPSFVQNEHTARRHAPRTYLARCLYAFPAKGLTGGERLSLVVRDAGERDTHVFTIDLSRMR